MEHDLTYFRLREEIEDFLYEEADLLDQRRFGEWLDRLAEDLHYFMPMRRNVAFGTHAEHENTRAGQDISWFDEDKWTLSKRVDQIMTGIHWAEEPLSRVCHFVTNIRVAAAKQAACEWARMDCLPGMRGVEASMAGKSKLTADAAEQTALRALSKSEQRGEADR